MKTITVKMPDSLAARLERQARRLGRAKSFLVREAVQTALNEGAASKSEDGPTAFERMESGLGCISSSEGDLSTNPARMEGFGG